MSDGKGHIAFNQLGLGALLKQFRLRVPPNQREYAWTRREVTTLLTDFSRSIHEGDSEYFLGTIVTIPQAPDELMVVDGQQRLATTAILLAEIRTHLKEYEDLIAEAIENSMLTDIDRERRQRVPKLRLNLDDNEFFRALIAGDDPGSPQRRSHHLLLDAFKQARNQVKRVLSTVDEKAYGDVLNRWLSFIEHGAQVILLRVPSHANAYKMFETLNDRGLKTSQADLVKNYLFGQSSDRISEVQQKWALMRGALDSLDEDDITVTFLRYVVMLTNGYLREPDVYEHVQRNTRGPSQTVTFLTEAESLANAYVSILNPNHEKWNSYMPSVRRAIETLNILNVKLMRPLMMAVAERFTPDETSHALERFVSWEARFLIAANTRTGGDVELPITRAARRVYAGDIFTTEDLTAEVIGAIPTDAVFKQEFAVASVSRSSLARYYLRSMEMSTRDNSVPFYVPNDNQLAINLEHILPRNPEGKWPLFDEDKVGFYIRRLGNQVLLNAVHNSDLKNSNFSAKRAVYKTTPYQLTRDVGNLDEWSPSEIDRRQKILAELAVKTWPI